MGGKLVVGALFAVVCGSGAILLATALGIEDPFQTLVAIPAAFFGGWLAARVVQLLGDR